MGLGTRSVACYALVVARRPFAIPGWVLVIIGVIETALVVWWAPWILASPVHHPLVVAHAPLWSRPMSPTAKLKVDGSRVTVRLIGVWASIGLLFLLTGELR